MLTLILEDITIKIGQNAVMNSELVKEAKQNYYWIHLDNLTSPHIIIEHDNPPKSLIKECCRLCKNYSKHNMKCNAIYTQVKYLTLTSKAGEVIVNKTLGTVKV